MTTSSLIQPYARLSRGVGGVPRALITLDSPVLAHMQVNVGSSHFTGLKEGHLPFIGTATKINPATPQDELVEIRAGISTQATSS
jgi:hypothetical protein